MSWIFSAVSLSIILLYWVPVTIGEQAKTEVVDKWYDEPLSEPQLSSKRRWYNYAQVLKMSILFYEAQRSGKLPGNNRVKWRKNSALNDKGNNREDLTGGWYDAGDHVKFGFPMAASVTVLAWGIVEYRKAYVAAGQYDQVLNSIKWATDYFIKAHTKKEEFYGQVMRYYVTRCSI